jgi:glycosyltransferase involved in cell wall biosynthesis
MPFFSVIVPVYNRPEEVAELLESLSQQLFEDFELILVEDGSSRKSDKLLGNYMENFSITYIDRENQGPAMARNTGMEVAKGDYMLFIDSDCIVPPDWMVKIFDQLKIDPVDCFGGPDRAAGSFNNVQKAISFAMTSFLTTGGIRGGDKQVDKFYPRSYNLGISRKLYQEMGGFPRTRMHPGEDMVFSVELMKRGYRTALFNNAFVFHKRRSTLNQFFRQVYKFGYTRYVISMVYPETKKILYWFPSLFLFGSVFSILAGILMHSFFFIPLLIFISLIFSASSIGNSSIKVGGLSIITSFIQLAGYGWGFARSLFRIEIKGKDDYGVLKDGFYPSDTT